MVCTPYSRYLFWTSPLKAHIGYYMTCRSSTSYLPGGTYVNSRGHPTFEVIFYIIYNTKHEVLHTIQPYTAVVYVTAAVCTCSRGYSVLLRSRFRLLSLLVDGGCEALCVHTLHLPTLTLTPNQSLALGHATTPRISLLLHSTEDLNAQVHSSPAVQNHKK